MKTVAIHTPHYAYNYGAQLQAFALGKAVQQCGFDIVYINRRTDYYFKYSSIFDKWQKKLQLKTRGKWFLAFEQNYLQPQTLPFLNTEELKNIEMSQYHAIIVGSDQMWRDDYFNELGYSVFLNFADGKKIRKIAYAVSFGKSTCIHPEDRRIKIEQMMDDFHSISVREKSGVSILKEVFHQKGFWVADPTLLYDADFYIKKLGLSYLQEQNNEIVTYILGASTENINKINKLASTLDIPLNHIYKRSTHWWMYKRPFVHINLFKKVPSVISWLNLIMNARYVFTDSFHGMVFCILFKKQFVVTSHPQLMFQ